MSTGPAIGCLVFSLALTFFVSQSLPFSKQLFNSICTKTANMDFSWDQLSDSFPPPQCGGPSASNSPRALSARGLDKKANREMCEKWRISNAGWKTVLLVADARMKQASLQMIFSFTKKYILWQNIFSLTTFICFNKRYFLWQVIFNERYLTKYIFFHKIFFLWQTKKFTHQVHRNQNIFFFSLAGLRPVITEY